MESECIGCGCTETKACTDSINPCHWLALDKVLGLGVCSSCPDALKTLEQHQEEMSKEFSE